MSGSRNFHARFALGVCFLLLVKTTFAQPPDPKTKFLRPTAELSNARVQTIHQDHIGFLWVGTADGLNRFDGYNFKVYRSIKGDTTSLVQSSVVDILQDSDNRLWIGTSSGGLHLYNYATDNFTRINDYSFSCEVKAITDDENILWFAGIKDGVSFIDRTEKSSGKKTRYRFPGHNHPIQMLTRGDDGVFWVGVRSEGVFRWVEGSSTLEKYVSPVHDKFVSDKFHRAVFDPAGKLWVATEGGVSRLDPKTGRIRNFTARPGELSVPNVLNLAMDGDFIWMVTENGGVCRFHRPTETFICFTHDKNDAASIADNSIWSVHKDHQNRLWFGGYSNGICVIDRVREKFSEADITLPNDIVNAILEDSHGRFWVGTEHGLVMRENGKVHHFVNTPDPGSLGANPVLSIFEDSGKNIWVGTWGGGLNRFTDQGTFVRYTPDEKPGSLSDANVFAVLETRTGEFLVGTYSGLNRLASPHARQFDVTLVENEFRFNNFIRTIFQDSSGKIWVGTIAELLHFDPRTKALVRFETTTNPDSITIGGLSNYIFEDRKQQLWVATNEGLHLVVNSKFVRRFSMADGLPNNLVLGILEDADGFLWLSTGAGITRFDPVNHTFRNYDVDDGVIPKGFKSGACFKDKQGRFYFGGKGINVFHPDSIRDNPYVPPVLVTAVRTADGPVTGDNIQRGDRGDITTITLLPDQNFFTIDFVGLNFSAPGKNRYAYQMESFDAKWNDIGDQRSVTFTNIDPGEYKFRVKAANNDGRWNEQGAAFRIIVMPHWYETLWFKVIAILLLGFVGVAAVRFRVQNVERRNRQLEDLVEKRTEQIARQNQELIDNREEVAAQRDLLSEKNQKLLDATRVIEEQNQQILKKNETLEAEIAERTKGLVEYSQQLEQFAFLSAHSLRAPVARILGLGSLLELIKDEPAEAVTIIDKLISTTNELDTVVRDLSKILEIRKGITPKLDDVDIAEELRLVKVNLASEIRATRAVIHEDLCAGRTVKTVKPYLESILLHLVGNAIKYRHPDRNPEIRVSTRYEANQFIISVQDNGLGMDLEANKEKLFMIYKRFHDHVEGKGMGLYLVKTQVVMLGGKIEVQSQPGQGTVFTIYLKSE